MPSTFATKRPKLEQLQYKGNAHDPVNAILGYHIHKNMLQGTKAVDRGLRRARFVVLREAPCPAVLCEMGFVSNAAEEKKLATSAYRETVTRALYKGILDYMAAVKRAQLASTAVPR